MHAPGRVCEAGVPPRNRHGRDIGAARARGMAVIVAMLVVAIVAVIATALLTRQASTLRLLRAEQLRAQTRIATDAGLRQVEQQLLAAAQDPWVRSGGAWSQPVQVHAPLSVQLQVVDAQGRFNLRNLILDGHVDPAQQAAWQRLCRQQAAAVVCQRLESTLLQRLTAAGAAGPLPLDVLDLARLAGLSATAVAGLDRRTTLLPLPTWLNANTADAQVLGAAVADADPVQVGALLEARAQGQWIINRGDLGNRLRLSITQTSVLNVGIGSEWFLVQGQVDADGAAVPVRALIWREQRDDQVRVQRIWTRIGA